MDVKIANWAWMGSRFVDKVLLANRLAKHNLKKAYLACRELVDLSENAWTQVKFGRC